jgi:hypothetical protein
VNILRSGQAVEKAVSQMHGKGGQRRRKRNRLTPGTVKFAAFHVLSIEGQSGLSILEVADRIQVRDMHMLVMKKFIVHRNMVVLKISHIVLHL